MLGQLPDDLLYYIAKKTNDLRSVNKLRKLTVGLYHLVEEVKLNDIVEVEFEKYNPIYYENVNVIVKVNQAQINTCDLSNFYGIEVIGDIIDISPIQRCTELKYLDLYTKRVSDISALEYCTKLETLILTGTNVTDISILQHCINLEVLSLAGTNVTDISVLQHCKKLEKLYLYSTKITNSTESTVVQFCPNLKYLDLLDTKIKTYNTRIKDLVINYINDSNNDNLKKLENLLSERSLIFKTIKDF